MTTTMNSPQLINEAVAVLDRRWWRYEHDWQAVEAEQGSDETPLADGMHELARNILTQLPITLWTNETDDHRIYSFDGCTIHPDDQTDLIGWAMNRLSITGRGLEELDAPGGAIEQLRGLGATVTHNNNLHTLASRSDF